MADPPSLKRKAHAELASPFDKKHSRSVPGKTVKNSITLDSAFKNWEKLNNKDQSNTSNAAPNTSCRRRNPLPKVDEEGFVEPRKIAKGNSIETMLTAPLRTDNSYQSLIDGADELTGLDNMETEQNSNPKKTNAEQDQNNDTRNENLSRSTETNNTKNYRPPPIFIPGSNVKNTVSVLKNAGLEQGTFLVTASNELHTVNTFTQEKFNTAKTALKNKEIKFYSHTPKSEKLKSVLLKGVSQDFSSEQVDEDLKNRNIPSVEIKKVTELKFTRDNQQMRHIIVQISQRSSLKELFKIKDVLHLITRYANCGKIGHPASYAGCPYLKFAKNERKHEAHRKNTAVVRNSDRMSRLASPQMSFAKVSAHHREAFPPLRT
ncbi:hypothetical protein KQX54_007660 [Cotesia glomerata]|uniref:Nucleic-acid-binding protein from transposon X-element n=1 Tax=Cotesia glomerata TaxID=32391 RepID=A0AAV7IFE5_COTGL|nr:hypothetical protein KQX54_007660 [Cotesia glomerata]